MSKWKIFFLLLIVSIIGSESRSRRQRRGIWPDVLAPGANTYASLGYYGMQSYIAYPETGFTYNAYNQPWNPYTQPYNPQIQFNNYNPYGYNQPYQYGPGQNIPYGGMPFNNQGNYNPNMAENPWPPGPSNIPGPMRSGLINPQIGRVKRHYRLASLSSNPIKK